LLVIFSIKNPNGIASNAFFLKPLNKYFSGINQRPKLEGMTPAIN